MHLVENSGKKQNIMVGNYVKENCEGGMCLIVQLEPIFEVF